ncbi:PilN domain-containing protein [Gemmatimonadota bacterium]
MVFEINLLPEKYRKKKIQIQLDSRALAVVGGAALVGLLGWTTVTQGNRLSSLREEVDLLTAQKAPLESQQARLRRLQEETNTLNQNIATLEGLGQRNEVLQRQLPENVWYRDFNQDPPQARGQVAGPPAERLLNISGVAMRKEGVSEFIARLKSEPLFEEVATNFIRPFRVPDTAEDVFEFSLIATLAPLSLEQLLQDLAGQVQQQMEALLEQVQPPPE